jgi:hypothetical protein
MSVQAAPRTSPLDAPVGEQATAKPRAAIGGWVGLGVLTVLAVALFWAFAALPFMDLPAHAGLIALRHRFTESAFEQRYFVLEPHIGPYSLFRFLGEAFVRVIGPVGAVRGLATLPVLATPLALLFARRTLFGDRTPTYGYVGLLLSFGFMTLLGFASYLLGVAVMLGGLVLWLRLSAIADQDDADPRASRRATLAMIAYAPLVFVAHGHAFLLFLLLAATTCVVGRRPLARLRKTWTLLPAIALAAYVAWVQRGSAVPDGSVPLHNELNTQFQGVLDKLSLLATPTLMTRSGIDLAIGVFLWVFAIAATVATVRDRRARARAAASSVTAADRDRSALFAGALVVSLIFLVLPHSVGWFGFVDGRLVPVVLALLLLAIDPQTLGRAVRAVHDRGLPLAAYALVTVALVASYRFQDEATGWREVLGRVPARASLLNLPLDPNSDVFTAHPFVHYDKLVLAEKDIVVSDVWFHQGTALYPTSDNPALRLPDSYSESNLKAIDWPAYQLEDWDYVLIRTRKDAPAPQVPDRLALDEHKGGWWLFRRIR